MTEETLFERVVQLPAAERVAFLDRECGGQPELRKRVEALLAADAVSHSPLERPLAVPEFTGEYTPSPEEPQAASRRTTAPRPDIQPGAVIAGKYTLVEMIGEGGMGAVWRAKQTEPVKRFVAIKLIKAGMDSKSVLARFDAERQALALMDHPNIAKVLDGGLDDHRPYFVMELVKGVPITEYCDAKKMMPPQRLELFMQVCQAIQHAHQKGIIHRDIKPSNVLVALYDDKPVVKVIDFGVAKATGGTLTEATIDSAFGVVVGTAQYMSPEQATFNNLDIDTRSDVYALGVLLYELLAGSPPFSGAELKKKGFLEILRVVREEEPPRPSTKLSTADALPSLSANRGTEPKKLTGLLRNELDWIVMKALEKDRTRRYETANGFAADVLRYLSGEPVQAHPPSASYRLRKFVRRYKVQVTAVAVVFLALVAGAVGTSLGLMEARRQTGIARGQEAEAMKQEAEAVKQAALARAEAAAKEQARAEEARQRVLAEAAADKERIATELTAARLKQIETINNTVFDIFAEFDIRKVKQGKDPVEHVLAQKLIAAGKKLDEKAIQDPLMLANLRGRLGQTLVNLGEAPAAIELLEVAVETHKAKLGPDHLGTLASMTNLAAAYLYVHKPNRALPLLEEALNLSKAKFGSDHPGTLSIMHNLTNGHLAGGKPDKALPLLEETFKFRKAKLGLDHPDTLVTMTNLATAYTYTGNLDSALPLLEEALARQKAKLGSDHPDTFISMSNLAGIYFKLNRLDRATALYEETIKGMETRLGRKHSDTQQTVIFLGGMYKEAGRLKDAISLLEEGYAASKTDPTLVDAALHLMDAYTKSGETVKFAGVLADVRKSFPKDNPKLASYLASYGLDFLMLKNWTAAELLSRESLAIREKAEPNNWTTFNTQSMLGGALLGQKKYAEAEPLLVKGYEGLKAREKSIPPQGAIRVPEALDRLIELYTATNKPDEVKKYKQLREGYKVKK